MLGSVALLLALILYAVLLSQFSGPFLNGELRAPYPLFVYSSHFLFLLLLANSLGLLVVRRMLLHKLWSRPPARYALMVIIPTLAFILFCVSGYQFLDILFGRDIYPIASVSAGDRVYRLAAREGSFNSDGGPHIPTVIWVFRCGSRGMLCQSIHRQEQDPLLPYEPRLELDQQAQQLVLWQGNGPPLARLPIEP